MTPPKKFTDYRPGDPAICIFPGKSKSPEPNAIEKVLCIVLDIIGWLLGATVFVVLCVFVGLPIILLLLGLIIWFVWCVIMTIGALL